MSIESLTPKEATYAFIALLDQVGGALCRFLETSLLSQSGQNWWKKNVLGVLNQEERVRINANNACKLEDLDFHVILKVLERNYKFLRRGLKLPQTGDDLIYEVRQIRNRCVGHRPVRGHDHEQLVRDIRTLESFCTTILRSSALAQEFAALIPIAQGQPSPIPADSAMPDPTPQPKAVPATRAPVVVPSAGSSLSSMFAGFNLTISQKKALEDLGSFLAEDKRDCFILNGYAGTGKTFLIGGIVKYLVACHKEVVLMAPTGRAAHVMKERHRIAAGTIHREIYALDRLREYKEVGEDGAVTFKFYFELRNNDLQHDTVFIVDEASMVSDIYSEAEFTRFGSGRLLRDLIEYLNFDGNDYRKKILFVGDNAQLPPVGMDFSPALDKEYLEKYIHSKVTGSELTHIVRQKEGNTILHNATAFRNMLAANDLSSFDFKCDGRSVCEISPDHFVRRYLEHIDRNGVTDTVIIGYSNALVKDYNTAVRAHLFPGSRILEPGDRVMLIKNSYRYEIELFNGQIGTVQSVADTSETHSAWINAGLDKDGNRKNINVIITFRDATIRFESLDGKFHDICCKYIEDLLSSSHRELSSEESKALYADFKNRYPKLHPDNSDFREMLMKDPYFNALQIKHAYAVTCHKAQGGEWSTVYVDFQHQDKLDHRAVRWSYTALTRAINQVVATNALHHNVLTPYRQRMSAAVAQAQPTSPGAPKPAQSSEPLTDLPDFVAEASAIDQQIYARLKAVLPDGFAIDDLTTGSYLSQWAVSKNVCYCLVKIHYNGQNKITSILLDKVSPGEWFNPLKSAVEQLKNIRLIVTSPAVSCVNPASGATAPHDFFFQTLSSRCISLNIRLVASDPLTAFHSRCTFDAGGEVFAVNYYFDARNRFTSYIPENGLSEDVLRLIADIHGTHCHAESQL